MILSTIGSAETHQYGQFSFTYDENIPDWVTPLKPKKAKGKKDGQSIEYAVIDRQVLALPNNFQYFYSQSLYFHSTQAVADGSEIQIQFNPEYQQLTIHNISVFRSKENLSRFDPRGIRLLQREEDLQSGIYNGAVTANITVADTRVGDRLDISYTISGRNPVYGPKVFGAYPMGWGVDVGQVQLRVLVDKNTSIQTKAHNTDLKVKKKKSGEYTQYLWTVSSAPATYDEGNNPLSKTIYPWVEFTEYKDWPEVELWARDLYDRLDNKSTELDQLAKSISKKQRDQWEYTAKALAYVQNEIRYLGLELGENSHLPYTPAEVLKNRYGDCKDKSNLLVQLLARENINSFPTLVSSQIREGIADLLPSPNAFDHVIVKVELHDKVLWLDPTRMFQGEKLDSIGFTPFGRGLVIGQNKEDPLESITPLPNQLDKVDIREHFVVKELKKPVKLHVSTKYSGTMAEIQRYLFSNNTREKMQEYYLNYYAKIYVNISPAGAIKVTDNLKENIFQVEESYEIEDFIKENSSYYSTEIYASSLIQYLEIPETLIRKSAVRIGDPKTVKQQVIVDFMEGLRLDIDSTPLKIDMPEFAFKSRSAFYADRFEYKGTMDIRKSWVNANDVNSYIEKLNTIRNDVNFSLNFLYPYKPEQSPAFKKLIQSIKEHGNKQN